MPEVAKPGSEFARETSRSHMRKRPNVGYVPSDRRHPCLQTLSRPRPGMGSFVGTGAVVRLPFVLAPRQRCTAEPKSSCLPSSPSPHRYNELRVPGARGHLNAPVEAAGGILLPLSGSLN